MTYWKSSATPNMEPVKLSELEAIQRRREAFFDYITSTNIPDEDIDSFEEVFGEVGF